MTINNVSTNEIKYNENYIINTTNNDVVDTNSLFNLDSTSSIDTDAIYYTNETETTEDIANKLKNEIKETKSKQGIIGGLWDGFKNLTGIGAGSNKAEEAIEDFENGKISQEEMEKAVANYTDGQEQCVDVVADIFSGIVSFGAFTLATGAGIAAAPFTGGASLGLVVAGFGIAGAAGAGTKAAIKGIDAAIGGREYDSLGYDLATGGINGLFAPITAGLGGAAGKAVAGKVGVNAIREGGEIIVKEGLEGTIKGSLTKTLLSTNIKYVGGSTSARALAMGTDMAVNGAISGAVDSGTRYLAGDTENKSLSGFLTEVGTGTVSGFVLSPVVGGGMRVVGNKIGNLTNNLQNNIDINYTKAKNAFANTPTIENPDTEVLKGISGVFKQAEEFVDNIHTKGSDLLNGVDKRLFDFDNNLSNIFNNAYDLNNEINRMSKENRAIITELLEDIAKGKDTSSKIAQLSENGILLSNMIDDKIGTFAKAVSDYLDTTILTVDDLTQKATNGIDFAKETLENATRLSKDAIEQGKKISGTNAYKQLGDLPERAKTLYSTLKSDKSALDQAAQDAKNKILSGDTQEALDDLIKYYDELDAFNAKLEEQISSMQSSAARSGISENIEILQERLSKLTASEKFQNMTREQQIQAIIEDSNILLSKFAQTFSSDDTLPSEVSTVLKQFTSNCNVSRDLPQAQALADELYGAGKYTLKKSFGAGTIGETYLAQTADGKEVVIKMLKDGVTPEKFAQDRAMFTKYINEFITDPTEKEYKLKLINSMFDAWDNELDFAIEAHSAKGLADNAKRYSVAQTLEIGTKNGRNISMVQEKASGIPLDNLLKMLQVYNENPTEYFTKYAKEIEANPALNSPETWMGDLGTIYQKAQNEQTMFVNKSGIRTIHADPHPGNVFIDFDAKTGSPKVVYIDAGNVVQRTSEETLQDIGLTLNIMIGNSRGIADSMLNGATLPSGTTKEQLAEQFAQMLDDRLYKAGINVKNTQYTQNTINGIMKELNIVPNASNSNLMKATLQRIETSRAINKVCGTSANKAVDIKDLMYGILKSFKANPKETINTIKPIIKWAYQNNDQAMITFFQMIMKDAGIKSTATIS